LINDAISFFWVQNQINEYKTSIGQLTRPIDEEIEEDYQFAMLVRVATSVSAVVGLIFVILGAIKKDKKIKYLHKNGKTPNLNQQITTKPNTSNTSADKEYEPYNIVSHPPHKRKLYILKQCF
jgi:hypothetical protein